MLAVPSRESVLAFLLLALTAAGNGRFCLWRPSSGLNH
jgi:hypothetical protein